MKLASLHFGMFVVVILGLLAPGAMTSTYAQADKSAELPDLAIGKNKDGALELFHVDEKGELQHRWQRKSGDSWSPWFSLGGAFLPGVSVSSQSDQTEVFAVTKQGGELRYATQLATASRNWSDWISLAGAAVRPPVAIARSADGRLEIFAPAAKGNSIKYIRQTDTQGGWSAWEDLGGNVLPGFVVMSGGENRLELFGADARDHSLVHSVRTVINENTNWSEWSSLGGSILPGLSVAQNSDGRLEVFAISRTNGIVLHIFQNSTNAPVTWSQWGALGGNYQPGFAVGQNRDGRLVIFAIKRQTREIMQSAQKTNAEPNAWTTWENMRWAGRGTLAIDRDRRGNLDLFAFDSVDENSLNHTRQIRGNLYWQDWSSLEQPPYPFVVRSWQADEGLPDGRILAIAQTPDGYLWTGTFKGLAKFDGLHFTKMDLGKLLGIKNPLITTLCTDPVGTLWIGASDSGLISYNGGKFTRFTKADGLAGDQVNSIRNGRGGSLWIGTTGGVSHYQNGNFTNYTEKEGLLSDIVRDVHEAHDGTVWIATSKGLNHFTGQRMDGYTRSNGLPKDLLRKIYEDRKGRMWFTSDNGIFLRRNQSFHAYNDRYGLSDGIVSSVCEDENGNLLAGTYSGLSRFREGRFINELNNEGLPLGRINTLFKDRDGTIWAGTQEGLARFTPKPFYARTRRQGLTHDNVMSVLQDRRGDMWLGTWGGGVDRLRDDETTAYTTNSGLDNNLCLSLCEGQDGSIWIGQEYKAGIARISNGKLTRITPKDGLIPAPVRVIHEDRLGRLWVGTSEGLSCLQNGKVTNYTVREHLAGNMVRSLCEDSAGNIWIGTDGGLSCWRNGGFTNFTTSEGLSDNLILALYEDHEQNLWIGTGSGGLVRYKNGRFTAYTSREGLFSDEIFEILEDNHGWLWMSCSKGIFRLRKSELDAFDDGKLENLTSIAYGKVDGMQSVLCSGVAKPASWKSRDGRLWFATSKGLVSFDPDYLKTNEKPPPVFIEQILSDTRPFPAEGDTPVPVATQSAETPAKIAPGRGELEFHFTALDLQRPENVRFRYQLEGEDEGWIEAGTRRVAYYNNLNPGKYTFRVSACNKDGVWNEAGATWAVELLPHFWETWWFRGSLLSLAIAICYGGMRYLTWKKLSLKLQRLEQENLIEHERSRIAQDMHDELGARLSEIVLNGNLAAKDNLSAERIRHLSGKMTRAARELVDRVDAIVWAINPKNDSLDRFTDYVCEYLQSYLEAASLRHTVDVPEEMPNCLLSSETRHNMYLVIKEALHNVVKHAQASHVRFQLRISNGLLFADIEDDGRGFLRENVSNLGNGLQSMEMRVKRLGGRFTLVTQPGSGTQIHFEIPLKGLLSK